MTTQQNYTADQATLDAMMVCAMSQIGDRASRVFEGTHAVAAAVFPEMTAREADDVAKNVTHRFGI
jgi:hypothetical protein